MTTAEGLLKTRIRKFFTANGIFWSSIQGGPGSKPGDPDLIACIKGHFVGIEVKTAGGRQSPIQKKREEEINASGGRYVVVRKMEEIEELLEEYNVSESKKE